MQFHSLSFIVFLPIVYVLYWKLFHKNLKRQNSLLLLASYFFYACWDYRFLSLLLLSTLIDFVSAQLMECNPKRRKLLLFISIITNLSILGIFKYFNFFIDSLSTSLSYIGLPVHQYSLQVILPIGISFYTFHGLSYIIDVYHSKIKAEKDYISYSVFVCFFPLLVAGPIERATHLLPQIKKKRIFSYAENVDGLRQILWGLFKKIVVADSCATIVDEVFKNYAHYQASTLIMAAILFAFQIYCDFSGYTDIAIGVARLFGIQLLHNFSFPYFSRNIAEFWRRWHISLSSWFRDYVYIPLGGNRGSLGRRIINIFIIFLLSGLWHGANWTFLFWGLLHALYYIPLLLMNQNRTYISDIASHKVLPSIKELIQITATFSLVVLAWIFFRSASLTDAFIYIENIFSVNVFSWPQLLNKSVVASIVLMLVIEWIGRQHKHALASFALSWNPYIRIGFYYFIVALIFFYAGEDHAFIYFQF